MNMYHSLEVRSGALSKSLAKNELIKVLINISLYTLLIVSTVLLSYYLIKTPNWEQSIITSISTIIYISGLVLIFMNIGFGFTFIYLLYLGIAHLGVAISQIIDSEALLKFRNYRGGVSWFFSSSTNYVIALTGIAMFVYIVSAIVASSISSLKKKNEQKHSIKDQEKFCIWDLFY